MTRTINNNSYSGIQRTATITEITTKSEDLSNLASLYSYLANIESRIESLDDCSTEEGAYLIRERTRLNAEIAQMTEIINNYDNQ